MHSAAEALYSRTAIALRAVLFDLKIIVYPALSTTPEPDPLFVLVGGPGGSAAQASSQLVTMLSKLQEDRDIVFVDQRGTGDSNGLPCKPDREDIESFTSPEIEITVEEVKKCLESYDANLRLYTTPIAMDDLDQVRTNSVTARSICGASPMEPAPLRSI